VRNRGPHNEAVLADCIGKNADEVRASSELSGPSGDDDSDGGLGDFLRIAGGSSNLCTYFRTPRLRVGNNDVVTSGPQLVWMKFTYDHSTRRSAPAADLPQSRYWRDIKNRWRCCRLRRFP